MFSEHRIPVPVPDKLGRVPERRSSTDTQKDSFEFKLLPDPEQRQLLAEAVEKLVDTVHGKPDSKRPKLGYGGMVFLDKSARPISTVFTALWHKKFPKERLPQTAFMHIGRELNDMTAGEVETLISNARSRYASFNNLPSGTKVAVVDEIMHTGSTRDHVAKIFKKLFPHLQAEYMALSVQNDERTDDPHARPRELFEVPEGRSKVAPWSAFLVSDRIPGLTGVIDPEEPSLTAQARWRKQKTGTPFRDKLPQRRKEAFEVSALEAFESVDSLKRLSFEEIVSGSELTSHPGLTSKQREDTLTYLREAWFDSFKRKVADVDRALQAYAAAYDRRAPLAVVFSERGSIRYSNVFSDFVHEFDLLIDHIEDLGFFKRWLERNPGVSHNHLPAEAADILVGIERSLLARTDRLSALAHGFEQSHFPAGGISTDEVERSAGYFAKLLRQELRQVVEEYWEHKK